MGLSDIKERPDVIINATSIGLSGGLSGDLSGELGGDLSGGAGLIDADWVRGAFCYDMSYGNAALFCDWAEHHGAANSVDGLGMLVEQAAQSYYLWRGKRPQTEPVLKMLRQA